MQEENEAVIKRLKEGLQKKIEGYTPITESRVNLSLDVEHYKLGGRALRPQRGRALVVAITGLHASGRSTVADSILHIARELGVRAARISLGEIFRGLAKEMNMDIDEFVRYVQERGLSEHLDKLLDSAIHRLVRRMHENGYQLVIVDGNVAPPLLKFLTPSDWVEVVKLATWAPRKVVAERAKNRDKYESLENAERFIIERTSRDAERYKQLAEISKEPYRTAYREAAEVLERLIKAEKEPPKIEGFSVIDTNATREEVLTRALRAIYESRRTETTP